MNRIRAVRLLTASCVAAIAATSAAVVNTGVADASGPTVTGAGSTWVQIALDQWRADIAHQGYSINYQGVGSSAGREFYIINQVDFAATEIPFQPDEVRQLQGEHKSYQYLPDVAGGTSLMYNLHNAAGSRITSLRMDATTAAKIFTGSITSWQDPAIQALNPGLAIRESTVIPVVRSDGSGTSAQFSLYLADQAASVWNAFVSAQGCPAPCSIWPTFNGSTQQSGSDGVANFVSNDAVGGGAIGYVEAGYAFGRGFPVASLHNASGNFTQPTSNSVAIALTHATLNADLTQNLTAVYRAPDPTAYPMSSYSYMVTPTANFDPAKGFVLGTWLIYIACGGQREAAPLGYSPLPPNLVAAVFGAVKRIPGAPTPPPIDAAHCPNPTITGESTAQAGTKSGSSSHSGTSGASATASAASAAAAAAAAASAGSTAAATGVSGVSAASGTAAATLGDAQRQQLFLLAEQAALAAKAPSGVPLLASGLGILLVVFVPALLGWRRGSRQRRMK
ncbi:MAG TPA: substrate-binding domain-containing protein [Candidatus Dormibacteraeota bacterium]|nr:substrate-binding domain-containing protein [Candidatus Dormibacteraeota bacterium]